MSEKLETKWCKKTLIVSYHDGKGKVSTYCIYSGNLKEEQLNQKFQELVHNIRNQDSGIGWSWQNACAGCSFVNPFSCLC